MHMENSLGPCDLGAELGNSLDETHIDVLSLRCLDPLYTVSEVSRTATPRAYPVPGQGQLTKVRTSSFIPAWNEKEKPIIELHRCNVGQIYLLLTDYL
jgi:hypothetical protein